MNGGGDRLFSPRALKEQDSKNALERLSDRGWFSRILSLPLQTPICFAFFSFSEKENQIGMGFIFTF